MDRITESKIARFFQKRVRERVLYLISSKKRGEIFGKLAHSAEDYLDGALIIEKSNRPLDKEAIESRLGKKVYIMEEHSALDGELCDIDTALAELWSCGSPYLLYGNGYLYVETEYDFSTHTAYLLKGHDRP
ncbi:MAG: hypothetical protein K2J77_06925 [Oscillospiraceae bacterium]|nr:hypothetical protein [Oscillospiraceae bacterium]